MKAHHAVMDKPALIMNANRRKQGSVKREAVIVRIIRSNYVSTVIIIPF